MFENIIETMEAEEADLVRKLDAVRQFLSAYRGVNDTSAAPARTVNGKLIKKPRPLDMRLDKFGPYGQRIIDYADKILPGCAGSPVLTRDLVAQIEAAGIEITGGNKVNSLSALLARSTRMKGWGRMGWTRTSPDNGEKFQAGHGQNENGATEVAPDGGKVGAPTPTFPWSNPRSGPAS